MKSRLRILIVPDKFKGSMSASQAADAIEKLLRCRMVGGKDASVVKLPLADGGDGSVEVLRRAFETGSASVASWSVVDIDTFDSLMRPVKAPVLLFERLDGTRCAMVEMASICGLAMLSPSERNPERTTTYGLGVAMAKAADLGVDELVIGIGGSSTNDCGRGMVEGWKSLRELSGGNIPRIRVACDVRNPLLGPDGATMVYGPQKGADEAMLERLENRVAQFAHDNGIDVAMPGGGAAGGTGAALSHFFGAVLEPGWSLFGSIVNLEEEIEAADIVVTAEGRFDSQSLSGKLIDGIAGLCRRHHKTMDVFCGQSTLKKDIWRKAGISNVFTLMEVEQDMHRCFSDGAAILSGEGLLVAGCDEAGRGPLAGPVFAAAVILPEDFDHPYLNDSKQLTEEQRQELRPIIEREAIAWSVAQIPPAEIDRINILNASILGMQNALDTMCSPRTGKIVSPRMVLVDGNRFKPYGSVPHHCIVKGDGRVKAIAAASVLAKTHRDEYMRLLAKEYPQYGWDRNMAYPTEEHREAIRRYGVTPHHRMSFTLLPEEERKLF